jgi:hypothetical protein
MNMSNPLDNKSRGSTTLTVNKKKWNVPKQTAWLLATGILLSISAFPLNYQNNYLVTISAVSGSDKGETTERYIYKTGEKVQVQVTMTNTSAKTLNVPKGEDYYRPQLFRDGQLVAYREAVSERVGKQEKGGSSRIVGFLFLKPNEPQSDIIDLDYWYEHLPSGHYQLSLQRIFFKRRAESNAVFFEITAYD